VTTKSSKLLHLDPLAIALEKRNKQSEEKVQPQARESNVSSQPILDKQPNMSSQPTEQPSGSPVSNQLNTGSQPKLSSQPVLSNQLEKNSLNLLASLPEIKGDTRVPHRYTDHLCRMLKPDEQAVYWQLYRLSWGWGKDSCFISNPKLSERSNVPLSSMKRAVAGLIAKGLIEKTGHTNGFGRDQGVEYRVSKLDWQPTASRQPNMSRQPNVDTIKIKDHKEHTQKDSGGPTLVTNDPVRSSPGVGVGSKFSLEECRRYAEHLRATGQGITNPGGYATTIHRTGEADTLIETFLEPEATPEQSRVDARQCPDCHGTSFWYPKGREGGVAKCNHDRLKV
jgi:hypothetical protein